MGREIKSVTDNEVVIATSNTAVNDYKDRLVKLIPSEIVTAYCTIWGLISGAVVAGDKTTLLWIVFLLLWALTPFYLYFVGGVKKPGQIVFTTLAFAIWVTVVGAPFATLLDFPASFIGSILLIVYTLFIPFVYKG